MDALQDQDLYIAEPEVVLAPLVLEWSWLLTGRIRPLFFSRFGDFRSILAQEARKLGLIAGHGQCFGFAPHPLMSGGRVSMERALVMPLGAWNRICSGTLRIASEG